MLDEIFQQIYEISLLNLYIYTDCALLFAICPHKRLCFSVLGSGIDENVHRVKYDELLSIGRNTPSQKEQGYPLWEEQLLKNALKIGHTYIDNLYEPYYCVLITIKNNNLFVTFRGTCNLNESLLDIEILLKSHILQKQPILARLEKIIENIYKELNTIITEAKTRGMCKSIIFSGHSLGAILCTLFVMKCARENHICLYDLESNEKSYFMFLLGMPSIGNQLFVDEVDTLLENNYINICNNGDIMMKASSHFIPNLNNVVKYETTHFCNFPYLCTKTVSVNLGDNTLTEIIGNEILVTILKIPGIIPAFISHSILKYVENIYLFTQNESIDKIELKNKILTVKFNNIFEKIHKILNIENTYKPIVFKGGNNKSKKKIKKTRKSKKMSL